MKDYMNAPEMHIITSFLAGDNLGYIKELEPSDFILAYNLFNSIKTQYTENKEINIALTATDGEFTLEELTELLKKYEKKTFKSCYKQMILEKASKKLVGIEKNDVEKVVNEVSKLITTTKLEESEDAGDIFMSFVNMMDDRIENRNNQILTGIEKLDNITGGLKKGELIVIGARPSVGKSAIALQFALNMAINKKVLFVSLEMSVASIGERIVCINSDIENSELKTGYIKNKEKFWLDVDKAAMKIPKNLIVLDRTFTLEGVENAVKKFKPDVLVIDYIGLLNTFEKFQTKREKIGHITRTLKIMSAEREVLIIGLQQLNRNAANVTPSVAELKDSGTLEEDSDIVMLLHKLKSDKDCNEYPAYDGKWKYYNDTGCDPVILMIEKHRNGQNGYIPLSYVGRKFTFKEL